MKEAKSKEILKKIDNLLEEEGVSKNAQYVTPEEKFEEVIIPGMKSSKETLATIYYKSRNRSGIMGKIKTKIQSVIISTVINVIEKQAMRQQKFNNLTYQAVSELVDENKRLREKLKKLSKELAN